MRTRTKLILARAASRLLVTLRRTVGAGACTTVRRGGFRWRLDLEEGIDLSIFLFGAFERSVDDASLRFISPGSLALDLGANVGAHTLPLAQAVGSRGRVIAVEATSYAFDKLRHNLALNPGLEERVLPVHAFLTDGTEIRAPDNAYSSWPLRPSCPVDEAYGGLAKSTQGARAMTVDELVDESIAGAVDFIKIDTDGHELAVFKGAEKTLKRCKPTLLLEMAPDAFVEESSFAEMIDLLRAFGYEFYALDGVTRMPDSPAELAAFIPHGAAINALALPSAGHG